MNLFPQLTEEQKRNTYNLPFKATQVKAGQKIAYSHWDANSQCAENVSAEQLTALKKQFKSGQSNTSSSTTTPTELPKVDQQTQDALVQQLKDALLQFIYSF